MTLRKFLSSIFHPQFWLRSRSSEGISEERLMQLKELQDMVSYHFNDLSLLQEALTHRSIKVEKGPSIRTNCRLEVLGDSVLGFMVMEHLFQRFPEADKKELSTKRAEMVSNDRLNELGSELGLMRFVEIGNSIQKNTEGAAKYIVADAMESLIAAIYLDGGYKAAWSFVKRKIIDSGRI